jgi:hypothetical protein
MLASSRARAGVVRAASSGLLAGLLIGLCSVPLAGPSAPVDREAELKAFTAYVDEALPVVVEMTGIDQADPVPVVMLMRSEVRDYLIETIEREYPEGELVKRGECLVALGLIPEGYDLEAGIIELITDEAGAFYDPRTDDMKGIADLHPMLKNPQMQKMIVSHELTHALQDRVVDLSSLYLDALSDMDREYCLRMIIEGMASNVMLPYMNDLTLEESPDVQAFMRTGFDMKYSGSGAGALGRCPLYVRESLLSPYAEGGGFVQTWLRKNPDKKLKALLLDMPSTSEQVMHYEKLEEGDEATPIDPSHLASVVPPGWKPFYANTLGEFDVLMLFKSHEDTERFAEELASGWDGCRWQAYRNEDGELVIVGLSVWDSKEDARDFAVGLKRVLADIRGADRYEVAREGVRVSFVIGPAGEGMRKMAASLGAAH